MTGTKDDDASKQVARSREDVVLDLGDIEIVEMEPKRADDADKSGLASARDFEEVVQLTAVARGQT